MTQQQTSNNTLHNSFQTAGAAHRTHQQYSDEYTQALAALEEAQVNGTVGRVNYLRARVTYLARKTQETKLDLLIALEQQRQRDTLAQQREEQCQWVWEE